MELNAFAYVLDEDDYMIQEALNETDPKKTPAYAALYHDLQDHELEGMKIYKIVISLDNAVEVS